jgi:hypothetical protein
MQITEKNRKAAQFTRDMDHFTDWANLADSYYGEYIINRRSAINPLLNTEYMPPIHSDWVSSKIHGDSFRYLATAFPVAFYGGTNFPAVTTPQHQPILLHIENAIKEASYITDLPADWDDEGAVPILINTFNNAANFLRIYSNYLFNSYNIFIPVPEINPCKDGSIDLAWRTNSARMLINIRSDKGEYYAFYYGDRYNNKMPIKGNIPLPEFSEFLAVWMKYLL